MAKPTAADIRDWSQVDLGNLGFGEDVALQRIVDQATAFLYAYTASQWSDAGVFAAGSGGGTVLEPLGLQAVRMMTEVMAFRAQEDIPETIADFDIIQSFSAGGYSETRRDPRQSIQIGIAGLAVLQSTLWPLMSDEKQDEWIRLTGGPNAPAFAVTEVDWSQTGAYPSRGELPQDPSPLTTDVSGPYPWG